MKWFYSKKSKQHYVFDHKRKKYGVGEKAGDAMDMCEKRGRSYTSMAEVITPFYNDDLFMA